MAGTNYRWAGSPPTVVGGSGSGGTAVQGITGNPAGAVNNTDPQNPIVTALPITGGNLNGFIGATGHRTVEGSNAKQGISTLVAGTVTVANTSVTANSRIFLTAQSLGTITVPSALAISARVPGTSFTILASALTDTSVVAYEIFEPA